MSKVIKKIIDGTLATLVGAAISYALIMLIFSAIDQELTNRENMANEIILSRQSVDRADAVRGDVLGADVVDKLERRWLK